MVVSKRISEHFARYGELCRDSLQGAIHSLNLGHRDVVPYLVDPGDKPYGRRLVFADDKVEVIVMNWAHESECLAHDHGDSFGWVHILKGRARHTLYKEIPGQLPEIREESFEDEGNMIFAPRKLIHQMGNPQSEPLVTLHFYAPPIHGMEVFSAERMASSIVTDDCGAWWPDAGQQVEERMLSMARTA